jgi:hypothetical protein
MILLISDIGLGLRSLAFPERQGAIPTLPGELVVKSASVV